MKMTSILKYLFAISITITMTQCGYVTNKVNGKGDVIQQEYELPEFSTINLSSGWEVELIPSETNKMLVSANENLFDELEYEVNNNILTIDAKGAIGNADKKLIQVFYTSSIEKLSVSSGVYVHSASALQTEKLSASFSSGCKAVLILQCEGLSVSASSGANVSLEGSSTAISYSASSGAGILAENLIGKAVSASASSGASINLAVNGNLNASSSSGAVIRYQGDVQQLKSSKSSGGSVKSM